MSNEKRIIILALLGDPMVPATSRDARAGGFNTDVKQWLATLSKRNYPVTVITNTSSYFQNKFQRISENITIHRIHLEESSFKNASALMEQYSYVYNAIKELMEQENIEPVFIHSYFWYSGYLAMKLSDFYQIPFVHTIIDLAAYKKIAKVSSDYSIQETCEHKIFPKAACIMAITEEEKRIFLENYNVEEKRVIVIGREAEQSFLHPDHNTQGIANNLSAATESSEKAENFLKNTYLSNSNWWNQGAFLYMGRIKELKGIPVIIKAWYQLYQHYKEYTPPLWIAGGTPNAIQDMRELIEKDISELSKLEESLKICWWGYLSPKSLSALFLKTAVLIAHSQYEAGGLVVIEAMSSGIPVIATPVGFAKDCIHNWKNGFLVPYQEVNILSRRMEHFILQPLLSQTLGSYARKTYYYYIKKWSCFEKHLSVYEYYWSGAKEYYGNMEVPNPAISLAEKSDFERGKLNTYPYLLSDLEKENIIDICKETVSVNNIILNDKLSNHSNIWSISSEEENFIIKTVYTLINKHKIWNTALINEANPSLERMQKILYSARSFYTINLLAYNEKQCYCFMKEYPLVSINGRSEMFHVMQLIKEFSNDMKQVLSPDEKTHLSCNLYKCNPVTPYEVFQEIVNFSDMFQAEFIREMQQYISALVSYFNTGCNEQYEKELVIHYGKNVSDHIVQTGTEYRLLPSDSIFEGTPGYDAANLLIEFWFCKEIKVQESIYTDLLKSACLYKISVKTITLWCILILMTKMKQNFVFLLTLNKEPYKHLLDILINILIV